jgi:hypothetical protein
MMLISSTEHFLGLVQLLSMPSSALAPAASPKLKKPRRVRPRSVKLLEPVTEYAIG